MKKVALGLSLFIFVSTVFLIVFYIYGPFAIRTVCFGDTCPDNGGTYIFYKKDYSKKECLAIKGDPVVGIG